MTVQLTDTLSINPSKINAVLKSDAGRAGDYYFVQYRDENGNPCQVRVIRNHKLDLQLKENRIKISSL